MIIVISGILALIGIYLGMTEEPRIDYTEAWKMLREDLKNE